MRWIAIPLILVGGVFLGLVFAKVQIGLSAAAAALLGALIGAGATLVITLLQLNHSRNQNLIDAKRKCYSEGLAIIRRATVYIHQGIFYPDGFSEEEKMLFFNRMSALALLASKEVRAFQKKFNEAMPKRLSDLDDPGYRVSKHKELLQISRELRTAMREELGIDE